LGPTPAEAGFTVEKPIWKGKEVIVALGDEVGDYSNIPFHAYSHCRPIGSH